MIVASYWGNWFYDWIWSAHGMGNPVDDIILFIGGYFITKFVLREIHAIHETMKQRHAEQKAHEAKMELSQQKLHDHLGTGHKL